MSSGIVSVSTLSQRDCRKAERLPVQVLEAFHVVPGPAHIVGADVEAAERVMRVRVGHGALEQRDLARDNILDRGSVDRIRAVGDTERAGGPHRPGLQSDAPLQLAAAVADRVAKGEHTEAEGAERLDCLRWIVAEACWSRCHDLSDIRTATGPAIRHNAKTPR